MLTQAATMLSLSRLLDSRRLDSVDDDAQANIYEALVRQKIHEKPVFRLLKDLLGSKESDVRESATSVLAGLAKNSVFEHYTMSSHRSNLCPVELREEILRVGIVESLGQRLRSVDSGVQRSAAKALSELAQYSAVNNTCILRH
jgi:HEAT repeat protein